jgi:alpha-L-arabinofuranosidase
MKISNEKVMQWECEGEMSKNTKKWLGYVSKLTQKYTHISNRNFLDKLKLIKNEICITSHEDDKSQLRWKLQLLHRIKSNICGICLKDYFTSNMSTTLHVHAIASRISEHVITNTDNNTYCWIAFIES